MPDVRRLSLKNHRAGRFAASFTVGGLMFAAAWLCAPLPAAAQATAGKTQSSAIPRLANEKPDLNGVWERPYVPDMSKDGANQKGAAPIPFTPEYAQIFKNYDPAKFDYTGRCLPQGLTRSMNSPFPARIVQTNDLVVILYEAWNVFEIVHTDGRPHPKDTYPLWAGNSVGKWDGDTLVVDTIGFNDKTNMDTVGHPHSDVMHTVERFTRTDDKHIAYEITIEDPKAFTRPWKNTRVFTLRPDWEIMEYSCEENNKDFTEGHIK
jgi:hypothetical protein